MGTPYLCARARCVWAVPCCDPEASWNGWLSRGSLSSSPSPGHCSVTRGREATVSREGLLATVKALLRAPALPDPRLSTERLCPATPLLGSRTDAAVAAVLAGAAARTFICALPLPARSRCLRRSGSSGDLEDRCCSLCCWRPLSCCHLGSSLAALPFPLRSLPWAVTRHNLGLYGQQLWQLVPSPKGATHSAQRSHHGRKGPQPLDLVTVDPQFVLCSPESSFLRVSYLSPGACLAGRVGALVTSCS